MKIKTKQMDFEAVMKLPRRTHKNPKRPNILFRSIVRVAAAGDLKDANFTFTEERMDLVKDEPCLILMNHSSFIDLEIVSKVMYPKPYCIVCTSDGFVGKEWLMRQIGCIPTNKVVTDVSLISDMKYALNKLNCSVLMYPEASYSFDGTPTPLPRRLGVLLKHLKVNVVSISTKGAFTRDPLYNCLQKRKINVSATIKCLFTKEELREKSVEELDQILDQEFTFDHFRWQFENNIQTPETFRADGLNRILFKCTNCNHEGQMKGMGTQLTCQSCGETWELSSLGQLSSSKNQTKFSHIPDWYAWQRQSIKESIQDGTYQLDTDVTIGMLVDYKAIYMVGDGHLKHDENGFVLDGCGGRLHYEQSPESSYSLYSDYFWYELGDIICIGTNDVLYYCFPKQPDVVARTRIAAEELFKLKHRDRRAK